MSDRVSVSNGELRTVRDAMRELNRMVDLLERGEADKFVLMRGSRMVAAVVPIRDVAASADGLGGHQLREAILRVMPAGASMHYKDLARELAEEGYAPGGQDPAATVLAQLGRMPEIGSVRSRSGIYRRRA